ncbi:hypothetical protein PISMIDRAFT_20023 [Pisolithus microcarpus 441]|uniref:Uncharacterized protein n=1 Tax=Pisolithus microcarpus 441 TaxID=765257 RepID=A0A0C9YS91_9AGAM|nr:hypothetical protein BKA83DRAFT_20023 [Pisolithus microcarpus]KIK10853.1 hypothetical protein PISMIDRAFT_20023 [Pisolithus microcarpus 441]
MLCHLSPFIPVTFAPLECPALCKSDVISTSPKVSLLSKTAFGTGVSATRLSKSSTPGYNKFSSVVSCLVLFAVTTVSMPIGFGYGRVVPVFADIV